MSEFEVKDWQRPWLDAVLSGDRIEMRQTRRGPRWVRIPNQPPTDAAPCGRNPRRPSMKPQPHNAKSTVMECPVCHLDIKATVTYELDLTPAEFAPGFELKVDVRPRMTAFNVSHSCPGRVENVDAARADVGAERQETQA